MRLIKVISIVISANALLAFSGCKESDTKQNDEVIELTVDRQEQTSSEAFLKAIKEGKWGQEIVLPKYISDLKDDEGAKAVSEFFSRFYSVEKNIKQISGVAALYGESEEVTAFQVREGTLAAINILYLGSMEGTSTIYLRNSSGDVVWKSEELSESQEYFLLLDGEEPGNYTVCWDSDIVIQTPEDIPKAPYAMVNVLAVPQEYQRLFEGGINVP